MMNLMGSIENPSAQPLQGNNNPQVATPTLQNQQPLEPTITYSSSTPESAPKKKISIKKLLLFFFGLTYNNPSGKKFTYHLQFDAPETKKCSPPQTESTFISDYQVFRPKDSSNGCALTLTDKDGN